ncbi:MAG: hypothetical protein JXA30_07535 [Deltaproteobacteria bacterium]|nr:hypothetical protein [Deltaproteobacteria bacterium]
MNTTVTFIDRESAFWRQGVEAEGDSISDSYFWYRLEQRKGFPFGFELGASQGYAMQTDMFSLGLQLRWSLFEGFRSGVGQLPDFAIRGSIQTLIGSRQVNLTVPSLDFVLSKPVSIDQGWIVSPYLGIQAVWIIASSEMVNLCYWESSDDSADESRLNCSENQQADTTLGSGNNRVFDDVQQTRWRMAVGMQGRYDIISATFAVIFDLAEPGVKTNQEKEAQLSRQIGLTFGFGMTY